MVRLRFGRFIARLIIFDYVQLHPVIAGSLSVSQNRQVIFRQCLKLYTLLLLALALVAYGFGQEAWLTLYQGQRKIIGVQSLTDAEFNLYLQSGAKFVVFEYCISVVVYTHMGISDAYFIQSGESTLSKSLRYSLISLLFGWLGFPHGPIQTIRSLISNFRGGRDVTKQVVILYRRFGKSFLGQYTFKQLPS